jgi:hypothetical protein
MCPWRSPTSQPGEDEASKAGCVATLLPEVLDAVGQPRPSPAAWIFAAAPWDNVGVENPNPVLEADVTQGPELTNSATDGVRGRVWSDLRVSL